MVQCSSSTLSTDQAPIHALASSLVSESKFDQRGSIAQRARLSPNIRSAPSPVLYMFRANGVCREDQYNDYGSFKNTKPAEFSSHPQQIGQHSARLNARGYNDTFGEVWAQSSVSPATETPFPPPTRYLEGTTDRSRHLGQNLKSALEISLAVSDPVLVDIFNRHRPVNWNPAERDEDNLRHAGGNTNNATPYQHEVLNGSDRALSPKFGLDVLDYMRYHESQKLLLPAVLAAKPGPLPKTPMTTPHTDHEPEIRKPIFWANEFCKREDDEERWDLSVVEWNTQQERNEAFLDVEWYLENPGSRDDRSGSEIAEKRLRVVLGHLSSTN